MTRGAAMPAWIAVEWNETGIRAWAIDGKGKTMMKARSARGLAQIGAKAFETALLQVISPWLLRDVTPVVACGLAPLAQDVAPDPAVPCAPLSIVPREIQLSDPRVRLYALPGVSQAQPADSLTGQEAQLRGAIAKSPDFDGVLCLPGEVTRWIHISAKEVVSFRSFLTGELVALLRDKSSLSTRVTAAKLDFTAFDEAVTETLSRPERLAQILAQLRSVPAGGASARAALGRMQGALIGAELAATRPYWLGQQVMLADMSPISALYGRALEAQGVIVQQEAGDALMLEGLKQAFGSLSETEPASSPAKG